VLVQRKAKPYLSGLENLRQPPTTSLSGARVFIVFRTRRISDDRVDTTAVKRHGLLLGYRETNGCQSNVRRDSSENAASENRDRSCQEDRRAV